MKGNFVPGEGIFQKDMPGMTAGLKTAFPNLAGQQFMSLTTFRKSGVGVVTPVWFVDVGDRLIFTTDPQAGKIKRIRNHSRVTVAPCKFNGTLLGPAAEGQARLLAEHEFGAAKQAFRGKYGLQFRFFDRLERLRSKDHTGRIFVEVRPVEEVVPEVG
jgi:PPOX class probable F420-dependent enzyme